MPAQTLQPMSLRGPGISIVNAFGPSLDIYIVCTFAAHICIYIYVYYVFGGPNTYNYVVYRFRPQISTNRPLHRDSNPFFGFS